MQVLDNETIKIQKGQYTQRISVGLSTILTVVQRIINAMNRCLKVEEVDVGLKDRIILNDPMIYRINPKE